MSNNTFQKGVKQFSWIINILFIIIGLLFSVLTITKVMPLGIFMLCIAITLITAIVVNTQIDFISRSFKRELNLILMYGRCNILTGGYPNSDVSHLFKHYGVYTKDKYNNLLKLQKELDHYKGAYHKRIKAFAELEEELVALKKAYNNLSNLNEQFENALIESDKLRAEEFIQYKKILDIYLKPKEDNELMKNIENKLKHLELLLTQDKEEKPIIRKRIVNKSK